MTSPAPAIGACLLVGLSLPVSSLAQTSSGNAASATATELDAIRVVGRQESGTYYADDTTGTKTALALRELPQSVRVITRQAIDDLGANKLDDVLDYVGGVSRQNSFGGLWDNIAIRGLPGNENTGMATLLNGFSSNRGFNAPRDLAGVERIEFLKGTAAALYGSSEPGGTLNIVSKRPLWSPGHSIEAYLGSHSLRRVAVDSSGPIADGTLAYRVNAAAEDRDSFRDHVDAERRVLVPAFTWRPGDATRLDYTGEYLRHETALDRGVVAVDNRLGAIPPERFLGEPADGNVEVENLTHQFVLQHDWNLAWRSRVGLSYRETSITGYSTEPTALRADGTLTRQRRFRDYDSDDTAVQAELLGDVATGTLEHELLFGVEHFRFSMDTLMLRVNPSASAPYAIDIHHPVYGQPQPTPLPNTDTYEKQRNTAFYLQDAIKLSEQWRLLAGVRMDNYEQSLLNRRNGSTRKQSPASTSPRIGLSWLPSPQWTVYANAGKSFRPNDGVDEAGNGFDPEKGRAMEFGTKWESRNQRIGATAAVFDIRKKNVLTSDPANPGHSVAAGELRSRGLEFDLSGQLGEHWRINASAVYNDVEVARDNTLETGGRLLGVPKLNGSVLAVYENTLGNGHRFGIGGGVTHMGRRLGEARTQAQADAGSAAFELPAYTTAKLVAHWRLSPVLRLTLDVDNLFDTTYYTHSYSRLWVTPGYTRTVTLGVQATF